MTDRPTTSRGWRTWAAAATLGLAGATAPLLSQAPLSAQPPGGSNGPNVAEIVNRMDEDDDGRVDPDEMRGRFQSFFQVLARDNGLNLSEPIKNDRLREILQARFGGGPSSGGSRSDSSRNSGNSAGDAVPLVPGFGVDAEGNPLTTNSFGPPPDGDSWTIIKQKYDRRVIDRVEESMDRYDRDRDGYLDRDELRRADWRGNPYDFDRNRDGKLSRGEVAERSKWRESSAYPGNSQNNSNQSGGPPPSSSTPPTSSSSTSSSSSSGGDDKVARYAEGLLKQYDANRDGVLQKSEWSNMRGEPKKADRDNNDLITKDELTRHLTDYSRGRSESSSGGGYYSRSSSGDKNDAVSERRTYRFTSPAERLPDGLPDWFAEKDADRDGQVAMAEFSTIWNDAKAREFATLDRNGDGVVTAAECLKNAAAETSKK